MGIVSSACRGTFGAMNGWYSSHAGKARAYSTAEEVIETANQIGNPLSTVDEALRVFSGRNLIHELTVAHCGGCIQPESNAEFAATPKGGEAVEIKLSYVSAVEVDGGNTYGSLQTLNQNKR